MKQNTKRKQRKRRGNSFTLIELLVVIAVIAILAGLCSRQSSDAATAKLLPYKNSSSTLRSYNFLYHGNYLKNGKSAPIPRENVA